MSGKKNLKITFIGVGIALNIVGAFIALNLKLPIYLDSIGTAVVAVIFGPIAGVLTGLLGSLVSGVAFDIYSLYFMPVQIFTGGLVGYAYKKGMLDGYKRIISMLFITAIISTVGAIITVKVFGGLTSSGSSYILVFLMNLGVNDVLAAFLVQFVTDYFDKLIAVSIAIMIVKRMPVNIKTKISS